MESTVPQGGIPSLRMQRPSVDFIDNHMPNLHEAFKNPGARYDPAVGHYVSTVSISAATANMEDISPTSQALQHRESAVSHEAMAEQYPTQRSLPPATAAMKFWAQIYNDSLEGLKSRHQAPKKRSETLYDIRTAENWEVIYTRLQLAREAYDGTKKGFRGRVKKVTRKIADHAAPVGRLAKFIPEETYTSPIRAAVDVVVDAVKVASEVRKKLTRSFDSDSLDRTFSDIELFLATFPEDENIKKASVDLVVATLKAIEDTIGFFIQNSVKRGFSAVITGENYQESILNSIESVNTCSKDLVHHGLNSHIAATRESMTAILQRTRQIELSQKQTNEGVAVILDDVAIIKDGGAHLLNRMQGLLDDGERNRQLYLEILEKQQMQIEQLRHQSEEQSRLIRQLTPSPQPNFPSLPWSSPLPLPLPQSRPVALLQGPSQPQPVFPWLIQMPGTQAHAFAGQPFWPPQYMQPNAVSNTSPSMSSDDLRKLLGIADIDESDINDILENRDLVPVSHRYRAEQVASTSQFRDWIVSPESRELLVHGEHRLDSGYALALSLVCATLTRALRRRARHIGLVFFCDRHAEDDDEFAGANSLIRSLIVQLLRYQSFDMAYLQDDVNLDRIRDNDISEACKLFGWLVRKLAQNVTLICLIDGIEQYENDEYEEDMVIVLRHILDLARDPSLLPSLKILVTSSSSTEAVQDAFTEDDCCFLSMAELPRINAESSMLRWRTTDLEDGAHMSGDEND